ncbi:hypothetical protein AB5N19_03385 [Seiridium cardinale]
MPVIAATVKVNAANTSAGFRHHDPEITAPILPSLLCHPTASTSTRWSLPRAPREQIGSLRGTAGGDATGRYCFMPNFSRDERRLNEGGWCNVHEGLEKGVVILCTTRSETEFVAKNVERGMGNHPSA